MSARKQPTVVRLSRVAMPLGTVAIVAGLSKYHAAEIGNYDFTTSGRFGWAIAYVALLLVSTYSAGLPERVLPRQAMYVAIAAGGVAALGVSIAALSLGTALLPRFVVFAGMVLLVPWAVACSALANRGTGDAAGHDRVVAVLGDLDASTLQDDLADALLGSATLVGALGLSVCREEPALLESLIHRETANVLVVDRSALADPVVVEVAGELHKSGLRIRSLEDFYLQWIGKLPVPELERSSLMFDIGEIHGGSYGRLSRLFDLAAAVVGGLALVVVTPFVLIGNLIGNRGPLLFRQQRVGKDGHEFSMLKFRSMRPNATAGEWTAEDDARVTRFGSILRLTHLDELPQVVNIARGELSVVGPRPEQPSYVEELSHKIPFYHFRHVVRPGLTGWAQVNYPYGADELDALEKLQFEFWYLRHQSLWLDVRIAMRTLRSVVGLAGR